MTEIQIFENRQFGSIRTLDENGKILFCGSDVAKALGYTNAPDALNRHCRAIVKRDTPIGGKIQAINFIPEGDVYRLITHSKLPAAEKFESWVFDVVLPTIRKTGQYKTPQKAMSDYQAMMAATRQQNAKIREALILERMANQYDGTYKQILHAHVTKALTGEFLLPLPKLEGKTYSAEEIGKMLGVSAHKVGQLANKAELKTDQYGQWFKDKARSSNKEVSCFRYYDTVIPVLKELLK